LKTKRVNINNRVLETCCASNKHLFWTFRLYLYLIATLIFNLCQLLMMFIWTSDSGFDFSAEVSSLFCKFSYFFTQFFAPTSHTCVCMAAIDQFLSILFEQLVFTLVLYRLNR